MYPVSKQLFFFGLVNLLVDHSKLKVVDKSMSAIAISYYKVYIMIQNLLIKLEEHISCLRTEDGL